MILGKKQSNKVKLIINSIVINESNAVELVGITTDNKLTFNEHMNNLCRNASFKLYALRRIRKYHGQAKLLYSVIASLITWQLSGCFVERINI